MLDTTVTTSRVQRYADLIHDSLNSFSDPLLEDRLLAISVSDKDVIRPIQENYEWPLRFPPQNPKNILFIPSLTRRTELYAKA